MALWFSGKNPGFASQSTTNQENFSDGNTEQHRVLHNYFDVKVRPFIDLIDSLRYHGIEKDLNLPAIAVIGDQSSGKSSVLEALSGVPLPRGSGIVTRCPLELKLRRAKIAGDWSAKISYDGNSEEISDPLEVEEYICKAQNDLAGDGVGICAELIRLEITSSEVSDLTLIDLPGIARVPVKGQPEDIGQQIKSLILKFISKNETINLVVVPCNVDIATTEALKMAQEVDPNGERTLAILTKPDLLDKGTEQNIVEIVQNKVIHLSKGYMIVKCRGQQQIIDKVTLAKATKDEIEFFKNHQHFRSLLREGKATVQCLAKKLTLELVDNIKKTVPSIAKQVKEQLNETTGELQRYEAGPPTDENEKLMYVVEELSDFTQKVIDLSQGNCGQRNLFPPLRSEFGKWEGILEEQLPCFVKEVEEVIQNYEDTFRGAELPGFINYSVFQTLVRNHVKKLEEPAKATMMSVRDIVYKEFINIAEECFERFPCLLFVAKDRIDNIKQRQETKVTERLENQFHMEYLVYTQDSIFWKTMKENRPGLLNHVKEAAQDLVMDATDLKTGNSDMLNKLSCYFQIGSQRLSDQVPMLIRFFILDEAARMLKKEMLSLLKECDINHLLREETETSLKRGELQNRMERLTMAQNQLNNFIK
ncbi:interferon-induced GTP-binding protein Mx3-like [Amia ocellicauda]|uniref:interferon-induced GTP-binding protein Mx3-like n=1 Tax=Amia ocellicauda TaxID=2972642 RepID=UPI003464D6AF